MKSLRKLNFILLWLSMLNIVIYLLLFSYGFVLQGTISQTIGGILDIISLFMSTCIALFLIGIATELIRHELK